MSPDQAYEFVLQQELYAGAKLCRHRLLPLHCLFKVYGRLNGTVCCVGAGCSGADAELGGTAHLFEQRGALPQGLGRDATLVQAGASDGPFAHESHLYSLFSGLDGCFVAAGACSYYYNVHSINIFRPASVPSAV